MLSTIDRWSICRQATYGVRGESLAFRLGIDQRSQVRRRRPPVTADPFGDVEIEVPDGLPVAREEQQLPITRQRDVALVEGVGIERLGRSWVTPRLVEVLAVRDVDVLSILLGVAG